MSKPRSKKFWVIFWSVSAVFLVCFYFALQIKKNPVGTLSSAIDYVPWLSGKDELKTVAYFGNYLLKNDGQEKTFMILFQNNMELRPGGGYIGSFGILKVKNGHVTLLQTHDLSNFDGRVPDGIQPPYPIKETLNVDSWKLRDSNWSPDFAVNAEKAEYFYHLGEGQENLDGIVAINTNVLTSFLKATGPIELEDYPGTYDSENAILTLEYQVEQGYAKQGIDRGERKSVMNELAAAIMQKVTTLNTSQKIDLAKIILEDLNNKDIQLNFKDAGMQEKARQAGWAGLVEKEWNKDYLMMADANMGALKSDYYMTRGFDYIVDLSGDKPKADLKITYTHSGKVKDWMTKDYLSYLRVYVPEGSWLENSSNTGEIKYGEELGKKYFGTLVKVPLDNTKTIEFTYTLANNLDSNDYNLLIQKESGVEKLSGHVTVIRKDGSRQEYTVDSKGDWEMRK